MERDECLGCRQRDDTIKKLRAENDAQHVAHEFERQNMQAQLDALIADKPLPTRTDAIAVRPESIPTPEGKSERRELRTVNSKTFLHPEKAADGKEIRTYRATLGAVCYRDDDGQLRSIDTTIRDLDGKIGIEWAPYKFTLHETGIGFTFESRQGGWCGVHLTHVGDMQIDGDAVYASEIVDNVVTFKNVAAGLDIVFKCLNDRVKTLRILHDANAPRTFEWEVESDKPELVDSTLTGTDAAGNQLELSAVTNGNVISETWDGVGTYPVEIDPSVTVNPTAAGDDGFQVGTNWSSQAGNTTMRVGSSLGAPYHSGIRFPNVTIPNAATITLATLGLTAASTSGVGGAGTIYAWDTDNAAQFDNSNLPGDATRTTASTSIVADATTGAKTWAITSIIQEVVDRAGFASGNAIAIPIIGSVVATVNFTSYSTYDNGSDIPYLSITYTAAAGGTAGKPLMLLGCG